MLTYFQCECGLISTATWRRKARCPKHGSDKMKKIERPPVITKVAVCVNCHWEAPYVLGDTDRCPTCEKMLTVIRYRVKP